MKRNNGSWKILSLAALAASGLAGGQASASVSVQTMTAASNSTYALTEDAMLELSPRDSLWNGPRLQFGVSYNVVNDPLVEFNAAHTQRTATLVDSINTLEITAGMFAMRDLYVGMDIPMNLVRIPGQGDQFGLGDIRLLGKYRVLTTKQALVAMSVIPELRFSSGSRQLFLSNGSMGAGLGVAFERDFGPVRTAVNLGYRYTPGAEYKGIDYRHQLPMAFGVHVPLAYGFGANLEAAGALSLPISSYNNPGELYLGGRYQVARDLAANLGASIGAIGGKGSADLRLVMGLKFSPTATVFTGVN